MPDIQDVSGGICQTSGERFLGYATPPQQKYVIISKVERLGYIEIGGFKE
jgi:hypothetical protein